MRTFLIALLGLASVALTAEPPKNPVFWYELTVERGTSSETFVGTSATEPGKMSIDMTGKQPIMFENLRTFGTKTSDTAPRWWPTREGAKLFIRPDRVLWYYHLPTDPTAE